MSDNSGTQNEPRKESFFDYFTYSGASLPGNDPKTTMSQSVKSDLDNIPPEVRRMIYKILLVNPILGTAEAVGYDVRYGLDAIYGLSPEILRTSRKIYEEALEVLYDQTFIINCADNVYAWAINKVPCPCPLLRNTNRNMHERESYSRAEIPIQSKAMNMARSWKVLVDSSNAEINFHQKFHEFCRAVCNSRAKKIEIVMLKTARGTSPQDSQHKYMEPWKTLAPLTMLRNVDKVIIRNEHPQELSEGDHIVVSDDPETAVYESHGPGRRLNRMLCTLAQSNKPVERLFEMRSLLVKLAQSFEMYLPFKLDMKFSNPLGNTMRHNGVEDEYELKKLGYERYLEYQVPNPYRRSRIHNANNYLEQCLSNARDADLTFQSRDFKLQRERIVIDLRQQYNNLIIASKGVKDFKARMPPQAVRRQDQDSVFALWLVLLEKYAAAFDREKDLETLAEFRRQKRRFDKLRATWPREIMLAKLDRMVEESDFSQFKKIAQELEDDMDKQLSEIKEAWESLFNADVYPGERLCIDPFVIK
ncbi:hypothetical protein NHQ30_003633 [Ciborinia camelliae]|nr:hypothetical protein NHQ30_003633 [Ciborinia camelliae]